MDSILSFLFKQLGWIIALIAVWNFPWHLG